MIERGKLQRYSFYAGPRNLGEMWTLTRAPATIVCVLSTHSLGWELRLMNGSRALRTQVCRSESEVFTTSDAWMAQAKATGYQ
jgi:hypothetical protein